MSEMCRALTGLGVILRRVTDCELIVHSFAQFSFVTRAADKPMPSLQEKECLIWSLDSDEAFFCCQAQFCDCCQICTQRVFSSFALAG